MYCVKPLRQTLTVWDRVRVKDVKFSYHLDQIFEREIPQLQHGNDGLIYTCVSTPYMAGTDPNMFVPASRCLISH